MQLPMLRPLLLAIYLAGCTVVFAQNGKFPAYAGHVNDFAGVLDGAAKQRLERLLLNFEERTATQVALVTVTTLNDQPIEEYANGLYRAWGIGAKAGPDKDKGALLLVALQDRKTRLEVGYGLEGDLPDGLAGETIRRMRPFLQQQQYSEGLYVGARTLVDTLAQKWNVSLEGIEDRRFAYSPRPSGGIGLHPVALIVLVIFLAIMAGIQNRRGGGGRGGPGSYWWAYPVIFNRGGGTFGGGGWNSSGWGGGSSSGGGWGGFGGGSSGGGGASDSW